MNPLLQCYYALGMEKQAAGTGKSTDGVYETLINILSKKRAGQGFRAQAADWLVNATGRPETGVALDMATHWPGKSNYAKELRAKLDEAKNVRRVAESPLSTDPTRANVTLRQLQRSIAEQQAIGRNARGILWRAGLGSLGAGVLGAGALAALSSSGGDSPEARPAQEGNLPPGVRRKTPALPPGGRRARTQQPPSQPSYSPINWDLNGPAPQGYSDKERKMMRDIGIIL